MTREKDFNRVYGINQEEKNYQIIRVKQNFKSLERHSTVLQVLFYTDTF